MRTVVCIASGCSLTQDDVDYCKGKAIVYVVKENHILAPWADVLYAADGDWWVDLYTKQDGATAFKGQRWTVDPVAAKQFGLNVIDYRPNCKWSIDPSYLATGGNSGFQALNLAVLREKPDRVLLLGYDMGNSKNAQKFEQQKNKHWWDGTINRGQRTSDFPQFIRRFNEAAPLIPVKVINCTVGGNLECFERAALRDVL